MIDKVLSRFKIKTKVVLFVLPFVVSISAVGLTGLYASGMLQSRMEISNNVLQSLTGFKELYASLDAFLKDTTEANRDKVHADLADQAAVLAVTRGQIGAGGVGAGTLDEAVQHVNVVDGIVQKLWTLKSQQNDTTAAIDKVRQEVINRRIAVTMAVNQMDQSIRADEGKAKAVLRDADNLWKGGDYLATFGVRIANAELHRPELVGRKSVWQYPVNTVDPTTGTPTSALSFSYDENIRERKFFKEPGFIIGVHVVRPKLYFKNLKGSLTHYLDQGLSWLPAIMRDQPETSLREFAKATGPISGPPTNDYWLDMRDLFMYGDQFSNIALNTIEHSFGGPTAALVRKYAADADVDALFVNAANNYLRADGVCQLSVKGSLQDLTGAHVAERSL